MNTEITGARKLSYKIALDVGKPVFYRDKKVEVKTSDELYSSSDIIKECINLVKERKDCLGHGIDHVRKVAIDAGAICLIEKGKDFENSELIHIVSLAHIAGVLHDIRRREKNHALVSAEEAGKLLTHFDLKQYEIDAVTASIANHEAFKPAAELGDPMAQFLSNALYDADKFRWGPDNFTDMLWDMVEYRKATLDSVLKGFMKGMEGIKKIRDTFRTETGKRYGPDFIDRGIEIGLTFYKKIIDLKSGS